MLELHKTMKNTSVPQPLDERQIITIETKINEMIFELYGLTDEEIKIVENYFNPK